MSYSPTDTDIFDMQRLAAGDDMTLNTIMGPWHDKVAVFLKHMTGDHDVPAAPLRKPLCVLSMLRHPAIASGEDESALLEAPNHEPPPDTEVVSSKRLLAVKVAIAGLPPELRESLWLFTYEDMSYKQIAEVAHCSIKTVGTRIYRARQMLKSLLTDMAS